MNIYPDWLPENLRERYDKVDSMTEFRNDPKHHLLLYNPNYESIGNWNTGKDKMKIGETYVLGRAHTAGEYEGHISWYEFTPASPEEIEKIIFPGIWYIMKKKNASEVF